MAGAARPRPLAARAVDGRLPSIPGWTRQGKELVLTNRFESFAAAIACVNRVAAEAEAMDHHPDMLISYRNVTFRLSSHDAGGITDRAFRLAARITAVLP